jgi:hypothetical protein
MRILLWTKQPGDPQAGAVAWFSHGDIVHAGFERGNGSVHELAPPDAHDRNLTDFERPFVHAFRLEGITPQMESQLERLFDLNIEAGIKYSYFDLLRYEFNIAQDGDQESYCSRYVMHCLALCQCPLPLVRCTQDQATPWDLWRAARLVEEAL